MGDGDDLLGYETPWYSWEWIDELNILSGGAGADTFYIPVNAYQEYEILLDDFNPLEDKIVLNPSRAGAGFTGYELSADGERRRKDINEMWEEVCKSINELIIVK